MSKTLSEWAIYDNGDLRSLNNQLVVKVQNNSALDDQEKEKILQQHETRMHNIDTVLETEKRKQEQELDRALKERLDRRHRIREKLNGKEIRREHGKIDTQAEQNLAQKKEAKFIELEKEHADEKKEILQNTDLALQRQQMQALDALNEEKKKQALLDIEAVNQQEVESRKDAVYKKFMGGFEREDLLTEMKRVLHDNHADSALQHLEKEKAD
jgi:hypothetical protein